MTAYRSIYSNSVLGYSYKTNYAPYLCRIAKEMGAYAEVVSFMEYCIARTIGYQGSRIIFNGPYKEYRDLEVAVNDGAIINVDNLSELQDMESIALAKGVAPIKIGIRCNFEIEENKNTRFGLDVFNESVKASCQGIFKRNNVEVVGLHCHFSTSARSLESFAERTSKILKIAETVFHSCALKYISIGGGFFGTIPENMKGRFKTEPPTFKEYGSRVASIMKEHFPAEDLTLILEPGAALVADAFSYYCKVKDIKSVRAATYVTVNGSYQNIKPVDQGTNLPIEIISGGESREYSNVEIVGYTCMEFDRLHKTEKADLSVGDYIKFSASVEI